MNLLEKMQFCIFAALVRFYNADAAEICKADLKIKYNVYNQIEEN